VLSFFSSRRNPTPSPAGECVPPWFRGGGGAHSLAGEGVGGSQFRRGDIHYVLCGKECRIAKPDNPCVGILVDDSVVHDTLRPVNQETTLSQNVKKFPVIKLSYPGLYTDIGSKCVYVKYS
jgi:hypothetical protein